MTYSFTEEAQNNAEKLVKAVTRLELTIQDWRTSGRPNYNEILGATTDLGDWVVNNMKADF